LSFFPHPKVSDLPEERKKGGSLVKRKEKAIAMVRLLSSEKDVAFLSACWRRKGGKEEKPSVLIVGGERGGTVFIHA